MINLQFIESFLLLAENLSFSKTAKIQRTTQPVISRQIKELELYLGKMLFIRTKRSVVLTHEGVEFRNQVMEPLSKLKKAFNHHHEQAENNIWDLKIASIKEAGEKFLYPKLIELKKKFPDCRVTLELMGSQEIEDKILKNEVDLGLIYLQSKRKSILHFNVRKDFPVLIGHTKFSKQEFKSLTKIPMVTYRQSDPYFQGFVDKYFSKNESKKIQIELSINSHKKIIDAIGELQAFAVIPYMSAEDEINAGRVHLISNGREYYDLALICHESYLFDSRKQDVLNFLKNEVE